MSDCNHDEIIRAIGRLEGKLNEIPQRVAVLELWQARMKGAIGILGVLWSLLIAVFVGEHVHG